MKKKIWGNPKKANFLIRIILVSSLFVLAFGIFGFLFSTNEKIQELSFGSVVLGIGLIGMLRIAIDIFENHNTEID